MEKTQKTVVLGVCGGIAAYKVAQVASTLTQQGIDVHVIMTKNATQFVTPLTFESLTGNRVVVDTFDRNFQWDVKHVSLAKRADVFLIAPATANIIAKMAYGLADDMLSTTVLAASCPKIVVPAMNTGMYENPATQRNLEILRRDGMVVMEPGVGRLACRDVGKGRLPRIEEIVECTRFYLSQKDLQGKTVLVTAGPTQEALDPVRYLTNHSTGKMGYAIAAAAARRGAKTILVSGPTGLQVPFGVECLPVKSAQEMFEAVTGRAPECDMIIKAAAVADYRPSQVSEQKMKKSDGQLNLSLQRTQDILGYLGEHKRPGQVLCGFSMETQNLLENSQRKLIKKNADCIVANNLFEPGAGFGVDTNVVTLITRQGHETLPQMEKSQVAQVLLDTLARMLPAQESGVSDQCEL